MTVKQIPNATIILNSQELRLLAELLEKEERVCRRSLLAMGRWTDRLENYVNILQGLTEKVEEGIKCSLGN